MSAVVAGDVVGLDSWLRRTARRHPHGTALEVDGARLDYATLDGLAARVAARITEATGGRPTAVGLLAARSVAAYAGYLGALRAGVPVVPLSPGTPAARNASICRAARVDVVVADDVDPGALAAGTGLPVVRLTGPRWWRADGPAAPARPARPSDIAYVLFTSGSTGRPKGVPIRHRQLAEYVPHCARRYGVGPGSRLSQTFDLTFDPSVFDMAVAWYGGATLVVPRAEEVLTPARFVRDNRITHWFSVPSVITLAGQLRGLRPGGMPGLRWSLFAGEQLTLDQARQWAAAAPDSVIENLYGPTELTVTCVAYRLQPDIQRWPRTSNGTVPIGRPYPHLETVLRTEDGTITPVVDGREGELCVRGSQRFEGYLDAADNRDRFVREDGDPTAPPAERDWYRTGDLVRVQDDELVHLGRLDDQVKIAGRRVELGEIESVLRTHPAVDEAIVVVTATPGGPTPHAAYLGEPVPERDLVDHVRRRLPPYMVPGRVTHVPTFPFTGNGKVDRARLRELLHTSG